MWFKVGRAFYSQNTPVLTTRQPVIRGQTDKTRQQRTDKPRTWWRRQGRQDEERRSSASKTKRIDSARTRR